VRLEGCVGVAAAEQPHHARPRAPAQQEVDLGHTSIFDTDACDLSLCACDCLLVAMYSFKKISFQASNMVLTAAHGRLLQTCRGNFFGDMRGRSDLHEVILAQLAVELRLSYAEAITCTV